MISIDTINRWIRWTGFGIYFVADETLSVGFHWVGFEGEAPAAFISRDVEKLNEARQTGEKILKRYDPSTCEARNAEGFAYCRGMKNAAALILRHLKGKHENPKP